VLQGWKGSPGGTWKAMKSLGRRGLVEAPSRRPPVEDADLPLRRDPSAEEYYELGPEPQPEHLEPTLHDPRIRDLSKRDGIAILKRTIREALDDGITDLAAAIAYYSFLAIPAVLLVAAGVFTLVASPDAITTLMDRLGAVLPAQTTELVESSLERLSRNEQGSLLMTAIGFVLALWTTTGAMTALLRALNRAYERQETRGFLRQRLVALQILGVLLAASALVFGLLVLGPVMSDWVGSLLGLEDVFGWIWWAAQWPVLIVGLLAAFATVLYLGPDVDHPRWDFLTPGAGFAVVAWLAASGLFAVYTSTFGSYDKAWGSLAAVIVMLTWLWLSALALLLGAELNAEAERSRELRAGQPAEQRLVAPTKG
jgi:membrane protein